MSREKAIDFEGWTQAILSEFDWFLKKVGRFVGDLSKHLHGAGFEQLYELEELSLQLQEKTCRKMNFDLEKNSLTLD